MFYINITLQCMLVIIIDCAYVDGGYMVKFEYFTPRSGTLYFHTSVLHSLNMSHRRVYKTFTSNHHMSIVVHLKILVPIHKLLVLLGVHSSQGPNIL